MLDNMFQGMFRKRGRPPDFPLQIGGYDKPSHEESKQIPVHQLREAPRQLPLPAVMEFEQSIVLQQEQPEISTAIVESSSSSQQHDVDMLDSHNRGLSQNPQQVMSPNQAIPNLVEEVDTPNVPDLPFFTNNEMKSSVKRVRVCIVNSVDLREQCYSKIKYCSKLFNKCTMTLIFMGQLMSNKRT